MHHARHATSCVIEMQVPEARACAVQANGQVAAVGGSAEMLLLQQQATTVTDLQGAFMMPVSLYESCASSTKVSISVHCHMSCLHGPDICIVEMTVFP